MPTLNKPLSLFRITRNARSAGILLAWLACSSLAFHDQIHHAAEAGDFAKLKAQLKEDPALAFSKNRLGDTPLFWAADKSVAELLLANHAKVNVKNDKGATPLHAAAFKGHGDVVELLRQHGVHE